MTAPTVFDSQMLSGIEKCPRYFKYKFIDGWQGRAQNDHLIFGGHFAHSLECFYKYRASGMTVDEALHAVVKLVLRESYGWQSMHTSKTRENLIRSIVWYVEQFKDEEIEVVKLANGLPAVEYSFRFEIDNGNFLAGHIDRLVTYGGHYYVMDQKTTGSTVNPNYFRNYQPDTQMSLYTFAGKVIYDLPVKGVIIDVAQIAVGFTRFERGFTFRTEDQLDEWYEDTLYWIQVAQDCVDRDYYPMNRQSCDKYGGCEFREICSRSPSVRPQFLKGEFEQKPVWDPLKVRTGNGEAK